MVEQMQNTQPTRVYVAEGHALSRYGIVRALSDSDEFDLVGEAADGRAAADDLTCLRPDVAVVAERLPLVSGLELLRLAEDGLPTRIVLLSGGLETSAVYAALAAGAAGYLSTDTTDARLRGVVASAARGEPSLAPDVQRLLMTEIQNSSAGELPVLTPRERQVLVLFGRGARRVADRRALARRRQHG